MNICFVFHLYVSLEVNEYISSFGCGYQLSSFKPILLRNNSLCQRDVEGKRLAFVNENKWEYLHDAIF